MNYKRAFLFALLAYVISFVVGLLFALIFDVDFSGDEPVPRFMWYVGLVASVIIMSSLTFWYFKSDSTKASMCNGLMFGSIAVVFGFILDAIIFIPAVLSGRANDLIKYYSTPLFWITLVVVIATTTLIGFFLGRKNGGDKPKEETLSEPKPAPKTFVPVPKMPSEPIEDAGEGSEPLKPDASPEASPSVPETPTPEEAPEVTPEQTPPSQPEPEQKPETPETPKTPDQTPPSPAEPVTPSPSIPDTPETPKTPVEAPATPEPKPEVPEPPAKTPPSPVEPPMPSPQPTPTPSPFNPPRTPTPHVADTDIGGAADAEDARGIDGGSAEEETKNVNEKPLT